MRILFVSPSNAIGGAEISLLEMAKYLHAKGHSVFVAIPQSSDSHYEALLKPFVQQFLNVPMMPWNRMHKLSWFNALKGWVKRIWISRGAYFYSVPRLVYFIRKYRIDLIHTNNIMSLDGAFAAKISGIPHVQHLREITGYGPDALFPMLGQVYPKTFRRLAECLHKVIIVNSKYVACASEILYPSGKIKLSYNLFGDDYFHEKNVERKENKILNVGLVANVTAKWKNHSMFIELAEKIIKEQPTIPVVFSIYGKVPDVNDTYLRRLQDQIQVAQIQDYVTFKGVYDQHTMYKEIDILFHATPREFFGRIFIEAMAHSVPVVAVRGGGADELLSDGENGFLFDIDDLGVAARQVRALCEDQLLYARIVKNGQTFARQFHSEKTGSALLKIYEEILT
jgi:glycosyltransferase involved in cell wall biosynthesis